MRLLAKLGVFSFWIVSAVAFAALTDFYIGLVLSAGTTAALALAADKWTGLFADEGV